MPNLAWIHLRGSRLWSLLILKSTVSYIHGVFLQTYLLTGMLQGLFFWVLWDQSVLKLFAIFLFRDCRLSLLFKFKIGSIIGFFV